MKTILTYQPDESLSFGDILLFWGTDRQQVRTLLNDKFEIADNIINYSRYNDGEAQQNVIQRRDIYKNYKGQDNFFYLNFDADDKLRDIETHHGLDIIIENVIIDFEMNVEEVADLLSDISPDRKLISAGEYFFKDLKLTIASSDSIGSEGNDLSYFYIIVRLKIPQIFIELLLGKGYSRKIVCF